MTIVGEAPSGVATGVSVVAGAAWVAVGAGVSTGGGVSFMRLITVVHIPFNFQCTLYIQWVPSKPFNWTCRASPNLMSPALSVNSLSSDDTRIWPPLACSEMRWARMTFLP